MTVTYTQLHNQLVLHDSAKTWRWYEAVGPSVTKVLEEFVSLPVDDTTGLPSSYTTTLVGASTVTLVAGALGGNMLLTAEAADNDGVNMQLTGEAYYFAGNHPAYFGIRFKCEDVDETDFCLGLTITDTSAATAVSDGIYFRTVDASAVMQFVVENTNVEDVIAAATLADATWITCEFYYDGTKVEAYVNGVSIGSVATSSTSFPDDEYLTPTIAFLQGAIADYDMTVDWMRAIQIIE